MILKNFIYSIKKIPKIIKDSMLYVFNVCLCKDMSCKCEIINLKCFEII
jgi:hypothetical protein